MLYMLIDFVRLRAQYDRVAWNLKPVVEELEVKLHDFGDDDFMLCMGNPVLMCVAASIALMNNEGYAMMLQWSGKDRKYIPVEVDLR